MGRVFFILWVTCAAVLVVHSQTAADLERKYPRREVYMLRPMVQLAARYAKDGSICEMKAEEVRFGDAVEKPNGGDREEALSGGFRTDRVVDELVPASERGELERSSANCERGCRFLRKYQNVIVAVDSSGFSTSELAKAVTIHWRYRSCDERADAQSGIAVQLENRYPHHEVYIVRPDVQMAPRFDKGGIVCTMQIEQMISHEAHSGFDENDLIDELVPYSERGEAKNSGEDCDGNTCREFRKYQNIIAEVYKSNFVEIPPTQLDPKTLEPQPTDAVSSPRAFAMKIQWRGRTCDENSSQ